MGSPPDGSALSELRAAVDTTLASGPIAFRHSLTPKTRAGREVANALMRNLSKSLRSSSLFVDGAMVGAGVLELEPPRFQMSFGAFGVLAIGGMEWKGPPGRAISALRERPSPRGGPLWLMAVAAGISSAEHDGEDPVQGTTCRRFVILSDVERGLARIGLVLAESAVEVAARISTDDVGRVRRVSFDDGINHWGIEATAFGVPAPTGWEHVPGS